jgi:hypothetical protein
VFVRDLPRLWWQWAALLRQEHLQRWRLLRHGHLQRERWRLLLAETWSRLLEWVLRNLRRARPGVL